MHTLPRVRGVRFPRGMSNTSSSSPTTRPTWLKVGRLALDTRYDQVDVVMSIGTRLRGQPAHLETTVWLRPPQGGREREALAEHLAPAPDGTP